jgi:hypothetical protein
VKCPHCLESFHDSSTRIDIVHLGKGADAGIWKAIYQVCPACDRLILSLSKRDHLRNESNKMVHPKGISRAPVDSSVPKQFADDYLEACAVFSDSAKASAALSRRCLQCLLRDVAKVKSGTLDAEITEILARNTLPSGLSASLDAVRTIGNFAAHPIKSKSTGEIVDVESGEAEWNLDTVEGLFDYFFVGPAKIKAKREAFNKKLVDSGKPPLK